MQVPGQAAHLILPYNHPSLWEDRSMVWETSRFVSLEINRQGVVSRGITLMVSGMTLDLGYNQGRSLLLTLPGHHL